MFKEGDRVEAIANSYCYRIGDRGTVVSGIGWLKLDKYKSNTGSNYTNVNFKKLKVTIRDIEVGDTLEMGHASVVVLAVCGEMIAVSQSDKKSFSGWYSMSYAESAWKLPKQKEETITIDGKTYNKEEVTERLSELKTV